MSATKATTMSDHVRRRLIDIGLRVAATAMAIVTASAIFVPAVGAAGMSDAAIACGGKTNEVAAEFDIARPSDIWRHFPAMLRAPELEDDTSPAHVVVFAGEVDLDGLVALPRKAPKVRDALCVVQSDGMVNFYDNVSRAGAKIP